MLKELTEMCRVIFSCINSERSNAMIEKMVNFAKNGKIPFKVNVTNDIIYGSSNYDLGILDLGEFKIYDSLETREFEDGSIGMTRYLRLTKGSGENERELIIELQNQSNNEDTAV